LPSQAVRERILEIPNFTEIQMKRILLLSLFCLSSFAQNSLNQACSEIKKPMTRVLGETLFMASKSGEIRSFDLKTNKLITTLNIEKRINDFEVLGNTLWAISNNELHMIDLSSGQVMGSFPTSYDDLEMNSKYEVAKAITSKDHLLYIVNGEKSLAIFDTDLLKITKERKFSLPQKGNHRSWATGISIFGDKLYVGVDNITYNFSTKKRALEGIVIYDIETLNRDHIVSVRQNLEAYHMPRLFTYKGSIISNNLFLYFFNDAKKLLKQKKITPQRRLYQFDSGEPVGSLAPYGNTFVGCFSNQSRSKTVFSKQVIQ
jgi:WD40 repeat protein